MGYLAIIARIDRLKHQVAIITQIFNKESHVGLLKKYQEEGIILISDTDKEDKIDVELIK